MIGAAADAAGSSAGTVADTTLGTTVYVRATDANDNNRRRVGIQRANFYGEVSGDLFTGDSIIDKEAAETFGTVSGVSASFGVLFRDISTFIDDPTAFVDGIGALLNVIGEEGLGVADRLIETYIKQFERKQAQNNPYGSLDEKKYPDLYDRFERNWYEGYVGGFLLKLVISAGVGKAAKSTIKNVDRVSDIADRLRDTRALRALARVQDATEAAKGRAVARVLLASDDAAEPVLSQADTAGQAIRIWRAQRNIDADVDALPEGQQATLGGVLARAGPDARQAIQRMDDATLADYTDLDLDPPTRARFASRYADLDADGRDAVQAFVDRTDDLVPEIRDGLRIGYARGDIDLQTPDGSNTIAEEIQTYDGFEQVTRVERTGPGTNVRGIVTGEDSGDIEVTGRFIGDGDAYIRERLSRNFDEVERIFRENGEGDLYEQDGVDAIKRLDETSDPGGIRGQIGEEVLQPEFASSKYGRGGFDFDGDSGSLDQGYIPEDDIPYDLDARAQGFDGLAIDNDGNLVIIETKIKNVNGRVTNSKAFGDTLSGGERQMSDVWVEDRLRNLVDNAETDEQKAFIRRLADDDGANAIDITERNGEISLNEVNQENLDTELIFYQDGVQTGELASRSLRQADNLEPTLDSVEIVKLGDVFTVT